MARRNFLIRTPEKRGTKKKLVPIYERKRSNRLLLDYTEEHNVVTCVQINSNERPKEKAIAFACEVFNDIELRRRRKMLCDGDCWECEYFNDKEMNRNLQYYLM